MNYQFRYQRSYEYTQTIPVNSNAIDVNFTTKCQTKSIVSNGKVIFKTFSDRGNGFNAGKYKFSITLSITQTQSKEFVKVAGIEYENLTGEFIKREGIGVSGGYDFEIEIV